MAERFGGQVMDTMDIENFTSVKTQGPSLLRIWKHMYVSTVWTS
jgi:alkyl hydroperoxide reductase subunit AhpF